MRNSQRHAVLAIVLAMFVSTAFAKSLQHDENPPDIQMIAKKTIDAINSNDPVGINDMFSDGFIRRKANGRSDISSYIKEQKARFGWISKIDDPMVIGSWGRFEVESNKGKWIMQIDLDQNGRIDRLTFKDAPTSLWVPKRNEVELRLPLRGKSYVIAGGATKEENSHSYATKDARFGIDFTELDENGHHFNKSDSENEDYYIFGREIVSAAEGIVVTVIEGVPDNAPSTINPHSYSGNTVIVKHSEFEYSVYMHMKQLSITVKPGQRVTSGQIIGKVGNSGTTSEPHLHFQMMNSAIAQSATGYPVYFRDVEVTKAGKSALVHDYSPRHGEIVLSK